jgi:flagellar hook assembly protein FlgD
VTIRIYEILDKKGRILKELANDEQSTSGVFEREWDGTDKNGNKVGTSAYMAVVTVKEDTGGKKLDRVKIGVKR